MAASSATGYEEALQDIEETFGIVPGWLEGLPAEDLVHEWPLNKRYLAGEWERPPKYRVLIGLAVAANVKCQ